MNFQLQKKNKAILVAALALTLLASGGFYTQQWRYLQQTATAIRSLETRMPSFPLCALDRNGLQNRMHEVTAQFNVPLTNIEINDNELDLSLSPVMFSSLIEWLGELQREDDLRVVKLKVTTVPEQSEVIVESLKLDYLCPDFSRGESDAE